MTINIGVAIQVVVGAFLAIVGIRGLLFREIIASRHVGLSFGKSEVVRGRRAIAFGVWLIVCGVAIATRGLLW